MRIYFLIFLYVAVESTLFAQSMTSKPNVIIFLTDDQGWGDLSVHGNSNLSTPNIDLLAKEGARFTHFYVSPVCSPTRAEILTGRYHARGGVYSTSAGGERLDADEKTIAQVFETAGYATAAYGKWHNGMQYPYHPNARGFDDFYGFCSGHWGDYFDPLLEHNGELVKGNGFMSDDLTDKALAFIEAHAAKPFFLYVPYNTPHSPMQVPDRWWNKFKNYNPTMLHSESEDIQFTRAALAMTENIDWNVGRVMQKLKDLRLDGNTIVIYLSDNGPNSWRWNGGMKGRKGSTDEGGIRSPLFIRWPGHIPQKEVPHIAAAIDLYPTLADLAGINLYIEKPLDGVSLKSLLVEEHANWKERFIFSHWNGRTSARSGQYRLDNEGRLYNIERDPGQLRDVSKDERAVADTLMKAVATWKKDVLSELPAIDNRPFPFGHPDFKYTQLPARDGTSHGNIKRSNRFPNCSFFTNWSTVDDKITWEIEVVADGAFEVMLYYTCPDKDAGSTFELRYGESKLRGKITEGYDPPLRGMEHDRVERQESYIKDFKPLKAGTMYFKKGRGTLTLSAVDIPGESVMDFRLLMFTRVE
jgi:arylsulfatase A-like enzyme